MSDPIFERYKEALKQGHVAVLRGRHKEALEHYRSAVEIADDRPLPHTSLGGVLLRLGRIDEALAAYAKALGRGPRDEGALNGRAEALLAAGRQSEAAEILERLADVLAASGREPEALGTLRRALELSETKRRRRRYVDLARALRIDDGEPEAALVEGAVIGGPEGPDEATELAGEPGLVVEGEAAAQVDAAAQPEAAPVAPDPEQLLLDADRARYEGRVDDALAGYVAAAETYLASGAPDAALDACQRGLRAAPDSASVHLTLARIYLARGWRDRAVEKLVLLDRLLELEGAVGTRQELATLAAQHLAAEPRLEALARGPAVAADAEQPAAPTSG